MNPTLFGIGKSLNILVVKHFRVYSDNSVITTIS